MKRIDTRVLDGEKKRDRSALQVGEPVVVEARGERDALTAEELRVPAPPH